jgi:hypothetical protein
LGRPAHARDDPQLLRRRGRVPAQHEPRQPCRSSPGSRSSALEKSWSGDHHPRRLQGPKHASGRFEGDKQLLENGQSFIFDRDETLGPTSASTWPHREISKRVEAGSRLLIDDGKLVCA